MINAGDMSSLMSPDGINRRGNSAGFGDVTMLGQYQFHNNAQTGTSAAVLFGFKAPTGSTNRRDNFGQLFEAEFQPGSGSSNDQRPVRLVKAAPNRPSHEPEPG